MINQDWMRFTHTGRVADYLAYSQTADYLTGSRTESYSAGSRAADCYTGSRAADCYTGSQAAGYLTGSDRKESEARDGADHCAYRYGTGSHTHRGL